MILEGLMTIGLLALVMGAIALIIYMLLRFKRGAYTSDKVIKSDSPTRDIRPTWDNGAPVELARRVERLEGLVEQMVQRIAEKGRADTTGPISKVGFQNNLNETSIADLCRKLAEHHRAAAESLAHFAEQSRPEVVPQPDLSPPSATVRPQKRVFSFNDGFLGHWWTDHGHKRWEDCVASLLEYFEDIEVEFVSPPGPTTSDWYILAVRERGEPTYILLPRKSVSWSHSIFGEFFRLPSEGGEREGLPIERLITPLPRAVKDRGRFVLVGGELGQVVTKKPGQS